MATFGKVLAAINVLAAIGFLVFAGMDYSRRQNWAYNYFRGQLAVNGLPVDVKDETGMLPGRDISTRLGKKVLDDIFRGTQGGTVTTQVEEVSQRQNQVQAEVDGAADLKAKAAVLSRYLLPLATRGDIRDDYIRRLQTLNPNGAEELKKDLDGYFERAVSPKKPTGEDRDIEDRRRSIADLLYNLDSSPEARARTQTVVGMAHYVGASERQIANLRAMAQRLDTAIAEEKAAFVREYQAVLPDLSRLAEELKSYQGKLTEQEQFVQQHTVLRNARQAEVQKFQQDIQQASQKAAAEMATLDALQRRLFALEQDFAKLQASNQRLDQEIRTKETGK
jgi:hypothetical protein